MGIDATLLVVADHSRILEEFEPGFGCIEHALALKRERDLWPQLKAIPGRPWRAVQLPCASSCGFLGGRPEAWGDREAGWLSTDPYGNVLHSFCGRLLAGASSEYPFNRAVLAFVAEHFPNRQVIVYWH